MTDPFIEREQARFQKELVMLHDYPEEELAAIIREVGFSCTLCGNCCTTGQNGHVFLLDSDTERAQQICANALIPAPFFEICNREGIFYVSGYALRAHTDGTCIHLTDKRCQIYENRFSICRVYPYMLHREHDDKGILAFRQISGLNEHGEYHMPITEEESLTIARETMRYEEAWLIQMINFFHAIAGHFNATGQRHIRKVYDNQMKEFKNGKTMQVQVFYKNHFVQHLVTIRDYEGILI